MNDLLICNVKVDSLNRETLLCPSKRFTNFTNDEMIVLWLQF